MIKEVSDKIEVIGDPLSSFIFLKCEKNRCINRKFEKKMDFMLQNNVI